MAGKVKGCNRDEDHKPPFFTVHVLAVEGGPGTSERGKQRRVARLFLSRLCVQCLRESVFGFKGADLFATLGVGREI
jgi:hypothetical protein